jgi:PAS domain S-box-containing protein
VVTSPPQPGPDFSLDDVRDVVFHTDADGRWTYLNAAWTEVTGHPVAEALGRGFLEFVHPDDRQRNLELFEPLIRREKDHCLHEIRYLRRGGGFRWIEVHARLTLADDGSATGTTGTLRDVTARREAAEAHRRLNEALRDNEARLRLALAAARQVEWEYRAPDDVLTAGPEWLEVTGVPLGTAAAHQAWILATHPEDRARVEGAIRGALAVAGDRLDVEFRVHTVDSQVRWLRVSGRATEHGEGGSPLRLSGLVMDVTELHSLQESLIAATRLAAVGTLAAGVAHEVNNPLAWVKGNLDYALERLQGAPPGALDPAELGTVLREACQGVERIGSIVKALRSLGRGEDSTERSAVDVRGEILSAVQMIRSQVLQRAQLVVEVPAELRPVSAGSSELGRVFLNLLLNAAQAIPEGDPARHLVAVRARDQGPEVVVEVSDSGTGVDPAIRDRIFDPFFTTKPPGVGTGLGLTMVRSIVNACGGRVELRSSPGQGTTFRVALPAAQPRPEPPPAEAEQPAEAGGGARHTVLIIDDEPLVGRSIQRWLGRRHEVAVLTSGAELLRLLEEGDRWDVVLCDLTMPDPDGIALYESVRTRAPELAHRWAFITGGVVSDRATTFLARQEVPTLHKPLEPGAVLELVDHLAGAAAAGARAYPARPT